jgi:hypothetical protein
LTPCIISWEEFQDCISLIEAIFPSDSHLRKTAGLMGYTSLCRFDMPASFEIISGFDGCASLREVIVPAESWTSEIKRFGNCAMKLLKVPESVAVLAFQGKADRLCRNIARIRRLCVSLGSAWSTQLLVSLAGSEHSPGEDSFRLHFSELRLFAAVFDEKAQIFNSIEVAV